MPVTGGGPDVALAGPFGLGADKWLHAASYAVVAGLAVWTVRARRARDGALALVAVVLAVAAFGAGIEVVQSFVPGRTASGGDAVANAVGATVGTLAARVLSPRWRPDLA
jgi:VanZ family protein